MFCNRLKNTIKLLYLTISNRYGWLRVKKCSADRYSFEVWEGLLAFFSQVHTCAFPLGKSHLLAHLCIAVFLLIWSDFWNFWSDLIDRLIDSSEHWCNEMFKRANNLAPISLSFAPFSTSLFYFRWKRCKSYMDREGRRQKMLSHMQNHNDHWSTTRTVGWLHPFVHFFACLCF